MMENAICVFRKQQTYFLKKKGQIPTIIKILYLNVYIEVSIIFRKLLNQGNKIFLTCKYLYSDGLQAVTKMFTRGNLFTTHLLSNLQFLPLLGYNILHFRLPSYQRRTQISAIYFLL